MLSLGRASTSTYDAKYARGSPTGITKLVVSFLHIDARTLSNNCKGVYAATQLCRKALASWRGEDGMFLV